ncbi:MarR family winged helix-turn-helix transcriptional regulator [Amaricoccus macauensis]|uniref:MarR family winged helix-turn-helix transcriptional regulator n=1 Tax=Amaricoccus macauensis TaxID=57001 RepID=UPI003C7DDAF4
MDHVAKILAQWRQERPDLDVTPMGLIGRLSRVHNHLAAEHAGLFARHGLNTSSFDVLATLRRAGKPYALSPSTLIAWTMVSSGTMTNRIDRLEAAGLVERRANPEDGRGSVIALTETGLALVDEVATEHVANQHRMVEGLSPDEIAQLDALLGRWLATFEQKPAQD